MAAGAAHRQAQESRTRCGDDVIEFVLTGHFILHQDHISDERAVTAEAQGHKRIVVTVRQFVSRELLQNESIVGCVLIEGTNDVVAVTPCIGAKPVIFVAVTVCIAGHVQPVTGPALPVAFRVQQPIDELFVGIRRGVILKRLHLFRAGWQPDQVKIDPADQCAA